MPQLSVLEKQLKTSYKSTSPPSLSIFSRCALLIIKEVYINNYKEKKIRNDDNAYQTIMTFTSKSTLITLKRSLIPPRRDLHLNSPSIFLEMIHFSSPLPLVHYPFVSFHHSFLPTFFISPFLHISLIPPFSLHLLFHPSPYLSYSSLLPIFHIPLFSIALSFLPSPQFSLLLFSLFLLFLPSPYPSYSSLLPTLFHLSYLSYSSLLPTFYTPLISLPLLFLHFPYLSHSSPLPTSHTPPFSLPLSSLFLPSPFSSSLRSSSSLLPYPRSRR